MTKFVLIIILFWQNNVVTTAEFDTQEACELARRQVMEAWLDDDSIRVICVAKGDSP